MQPAELLSLALICVCILNAVAATAEGHRRDADTEKTNNLSVSYKCGGHGRRGSSRLINGYHAKPAEFPSYVQVKIKNTRSAGCGGVIISELLVLTAAHCIKENITSAKILVGDIRRGKGRPLSVAEICLPPDWISIDKSANISDIAILVMEQPIEFDEFVQPACLPSIKIDSSYQVYLVGQGKLSKKPKDSPTKLQVVPVRKEKMSHCPSNNDCYIWTDANYKGSACSGDSGSAAYATINNQQTVVGIISRAYCDERETWLAQVYESLSLIEEMVEHCRPI